MTKIKFAATAALAALALASAGVIAAGAGRPEDPKPAMKPKARPAGRSPGRSRRRRSRSRRSRSRGGSSPPTASPSPGPRSAGPTSTATPPMPKATSGPDGRFTIRLPEAERGRRRPRTADFPGSSPRPPGFGIGWAEGVLRADRPAEQVVDAHSRKGRRSKGGSSTSKAGPSPGRGQGQRDLVRREGGPGRLDRQGRNGAAGNLWQGLESLSLDELPDRSRRGPAADGRFKLTGIGRDRIADLIVSGPGIATTQVYAFSRPEPEIRTVDRGHDATRAVHRPRPEVPARPAAERSGSRGSSATRTRAGRSPAWRSRRPSSTSTA